MFYFYFYGPIVKKNNDLLTHKSAKKTTVGIAINHHKLNHSIRSIRSKLSWRIFIFAPSSAPMIPLQSWALSVFLIFSIIKMICFYFYLHYFPVNNLFLYVLLKEPTPSQINLMKNEKNPFLLLKKLKNVPTSGFQDPVAMAEEGAQPERSWPPQMPNKSLEDGNHETIKITHFFSVHTDSKTMFTHAYNNKHTNT